MATRMQQRRGTATQWSTANPVLGAGEIGFETNTGKFKIGDGSTAWASLNYYVDANSILGGISGTDLPAALDTLNELAAALGDDANYATTVTNALATKAPLASPTFTGTVSGITKSMVGLGNVDNTSDINKPVSTATQIALDLKANSANPNFTGTAALPSTTSIGSITSTEIGYLGGVTSAIQTQLDTKAPTASPTFTGTVSLPSTTAIGDVSSTEIGYVNGVTSAIQTQIDAKQATITGGATTITATDLAASKALISNAQGKVAVSTVTDTELGYLSGVTSGIQTQIDGKLATSTASSTYAPLSGPTFTGTVTLPSTTSIGDVSATELGYVNGVTSAIQTQLDAKAPTASPTFTGTVSGITATMVGLGNVDNTSDANKPVSTATQTALDGKLSLSGGTMTGTLTLSGAPTNALDAATKAYADSIAEGLHIHASCVAATSANVDISTALEAGDIVDGVTLVAGDRVLVKSQTNTAQNGIYVVQASGAALRASDFNEPQEVDGGDFVFVTGGTLYDNTGWVQTTTNVVTIGTDPIVFTQFSGAGSITAGTNISVSGTQVSTINNPTFSGVITASAGVAFSDGTQTKEGVPSITTISQKTDSYTLAALTERDTIIEISKASATTLTIPADSTVNFPVGTTLDIIQTGAGQVTIAGAGGVTVNATPGLKLRAQWSSATLLKRAANTWLVFGDLSS